MDKREIPTKNYAILVGVILLIICACFAFYNLYNIYQENKVKTSPLATTSILYEDLKNATKEIDADTFLVVSYVQDKDVHESERQIKKLLNKKNLLDNVMYLDITDYRTEENFKDDLNKVLKLEGKTIIKEFPAVVYYKDGVPTKTIDSRDHLLNSNDFAQMIDSYELAS